MKFVTDNEVSVLVVIKYYNIDIVVIDDIRSKRES